jgi:hypothetical protein
VYSVFKEVDFGTSLINGPFSNTNIADAFREADAAGEETFVEGWCRDNSRIVRATNPSQNDARIIPALILSRMMMFVLLGCDFSGRLV